MEIKRPYVSPELFSGDVINDFMKRYEQSRQRYGNHGFISMAEVSGKLYEEVDEVRHEQHMKDQEKYMDELLDVALTALYGYASLMAQSRSKELDLSLTQKKCTESPPQ